MKTKGSSLIEIIVALAIVAIIGIAFTLGGSGPMAEVNRENVRTQGDVMSRAITAHPNPQVDRFLTRENVVKWMERMDTPGRIFYIYIMNWNGEVTHYFVAQYRPVSVATFLTNTRQLVRRGDGVTTMPAPALDGTYYGEGGASDQFFFFDAQTDAYIELKGLNYFVADQPLAMNVPQFTFAAAE